MRHRAEETALKGVECAKAALTEAEITFELVMAKAVKRYEDAEMNLVRAENRVEQMRIWDQRRDEISSAVLQGATAAAIAKTYGLSRARAAQLLYRAQRDNKGTR